MVCYVNAQLEKWTVYGTIFEVNSSIGKLRYLLLGRFDKKDTVDF